MKFELQQKSKIFLYFLSGIALPCLLLSYFAFRGIQNDRALYEQQSFNKNQKIAQRIVETANHQLTEIEQSIGDLLQSIADPKIVDSLHTQKNKYPLIDEFFLFDQSTGNIELPTAHLLFTLTSDFEFSAVQRKSLSLPNYAEGLQNEFQQKSFEKAIENYQQAYIQAQDQQSKAEVINALARVQQKARRFRDAIKSYQKLHQEFGKLISYSGIPTGLAAQMESGFIFSTIKDTLGAIQTYLNALNELLHGSWALEKSQYHFWSRALKDSLEKIFSRVNLTSPFSSYLNAFKKIEIQENIQVKLTDRLLKFRTEAGGAISERISSQSNWSHQFSLSINNQEYFISLLTQSKNKIEHDQKFVGMLWQINVVKDSLVSSLLKENLAKNNIAWRVIDQYNQSILETTESLPENRKLQVKTTFVNNFPDWTLEFFQQNPHLIETILTSRRGIYFYIFMLIAGILIFGSILTVRSVSHELELAKLKSDFVSTVSHEFRSPLTSIRQLAEMLQRGRVPSEQRRQKYYDVIVEQSERLSLLINNVLDFARLEEGRKQFYFEMIDIGTLLNDIILTFQHQVRHEDFELKSEIDKSLPMTMADRSAITQAITNLVDNAIKYSGEVKKIYITAFMKNQYLHISVQDYGIGITKEDLNKVFDRFYRGSDESIQSKVKGTGLGLTLVKQIIEKHQGSIYVESKPGKGSTFTIKLPIADL